MDRIIFRCDCTLYDMDGMLYYRSDGHIFINRNFLEHICQYLDYSHLKLLKPINRLRIKNTDPIFDLSGLIDFINERLDVDPFFRLYHEKGMYDRYREFKFVINNFRIKALRYSGLKPRQVKW